MVITDTYTTLDSLILTSNITPGTNCTNVIVPNIGSTISSAGGGVFDWTTFAKTSTTGAVYGTYPILCDSDTPAGCNEPGACAITTIGSLSVSAKYANYTYKYKNISSVTDDIDYSISIDAGLYCPFNVSGDMPYIVRSEIAGYSMLFPTRSLDGSTACMDGTAYPPLDAGLSVWDENFQADVGNNIIDPKNVDHWANEILFRSIHGSRQIVNTDNMSSAGSSSSIKNYGNILEYLVSNPKASLSVLYDNIPYDYDTNAESPNFRLQGAIRIYGPAAIGDSIRITYNGNPYTITVRDNGNDVYVECTELEAAGLIMERAVETTSIYVREAGTQSNQPGASERVISTCHSPSAYGASASCVYGGDLTFNDTIVQAGSPTHCFAAPCPNEAFVPDSYAVINPSIDNPVPCSAFPKDSASADSASPLDNFFTKFGGSLILGGPGIGGGPLECQGYYYNTCRNKQNCCDGDTNIIRTVSYRIKDCHYDFTMYGLLTKSINNIGQLINTNTNTITCGPDIGSAYNDDLAYVSSIAPKCCDCTLPNTGYKANPTPDDCPGIYDPCCVDYCNGELGVKSTDNCYEVASLTCKEHMLVSTTASNTVSYEVVESTTSTTSTDNVYDPNFSRTICTFIYDNNEIKLYLGAPKTRNGVEIYNGGNCASLSTSSCPSIQITLPNSNYGIDDTISSSCDNCSSASNKIKILDNPQWEFQTDTVYCLLATAIIGGGNNGTDFTHNFECICQDYEGQTATCPRPSNEDIANYAMLAEKYDRGRKCGKKVDRSCTDWHHFMARPEFGSSASQGISSVCSNSIAVENAYHVGVPDWTSNGDAVQGFMEGFRNRMEEIYRNRHFCTNSYEYSADDLIEGVIPGSCSMEITTVNWPVSAIQLCASLDDNGTTTYEVKNENSGISVVIAYMKYQYKHPVNVMDKIIDNNGDIASADCRVYFSSGGATGCRAKYFGNMKEKLQSTERRNSRCTSSPNCYDKTRPCDPGNGCCRVDLTGTNYLT